MWTGGRMNEHDKASSSFPKFWECAQKKIYELVKKILKRYFIA